MQIYQIEIFGASGARQSLPVPVNGGNRLRLLAQSDVRYLLRNTASDTAPVKLKASRSGAHLLISVDQGLEPSLELLGFFDAYTAGDTPLLSISPEGHMLVWQPHQPLGERGLLELSSGSLALDMIAAPSMLDPTALTATSAALNPNGWTPLGLQLQSLTSVVPAWAYVLPATAWSLRSAKQTAAATDEPEDPADKLSGKLSEDTDTGDSSTDSITSSSAPEISGTAPANAKVVVTVNGKDYEVTVDAEGQFSAKLDALPDGTYTADLKATDSAGTITTAKATAFTIDTVAPALPSDLTIAPSQLSAGQALVVFDALSGDNVLNRSDRFGAVSVSAKLHGDFQSDDLFSFRATPNGKSEVKKDATLSVTDKVASVSGLFNGADLMDTSTKSLLAWLDATDLAGNAATLQQTKTFSVDETFVPTASTVGVNTTFTATEAFEVLSLLGGTPTQQVNANTSSNSYSAAVFLRDGAGNTKSSLALNKDVLQPQVNAAALELGKDSLVFDSSTMSLAGLTLLQSAQIKISAGVLQGLALTGAWRGGNDRQQLKLSNASEGLSASTVDLLGVLDASGSETQAWQKDTSANVSGQQVWFIENSSFKLEVFMPNDYKVI